jgi:hypothetical protein
VNSFGKAFAHVQNCLLTKTAHGTNQIVELNKTLTQARSIKKKEQKMVGSESG